MEVVEIAEMSTTGDDGALVFFQMLFVVKDANGLCYHVTSNTRSWNFSEENVQKMTPIPTEVIWPEFVPGMTRANPYSLDHSFVKRPSLLDCSEDALALECYEPVLPCNLMRHEALMCENLLQHPHPNVATYLGCEVHNGLIMGLCFERYSKSLGMISLKSMEWIDRVVQEVKTGLRHLHSIGIMHGDIKESNIMFGDDDGLPVIIDFDSARYIGEEIAWANAIKFGFVSPDLEGYRYAQPAFDFAALREMERGLRERFEYQILEESAEGATKGPVH